MIRNHDLYSYPKIDYRSPTTANGLGSLNIQLEQRSYFRQTDDPIADPLQKALTLVTSSIEAAVAAVESGPVGDEVKRLRKQLANAKAEEIDAAARVNDLSKRRSQDLREGKTTSPEKVRIARAAHVAAGELVAELTALLNDAEARLTAAIQTAKTETIQALSSKTQAELEASERAAANTIVTALQPVFVLQSSLRDLTRRFDSVRNPKAAPLPPLDVPVSENRGRSVRIESPRIDDEADDDVLAQLPGPPVEVVNSL